MPESSTDLLTRGEAAAILQVAPKTVTRWADTGYLPSVRAGAKGWRRFRRADVLALLEPGTAA